MTASTRFAKLLIATLGSLCAVPQISYAINYCSPNNVYSTQNLGVVTTSPYTACPYGDVQVSPRCTTLTFSKPGPFSMLVGFNYEPECPGELYEVTFTGTFAISGYIRPKYQVVGLYYAPPGAKSTVTYSDGFLSGTNTQMSNSFGTSVTVSNSGTVGFDFYVVQAGGTETFNYGWEETITSATAVSIQQQQTNGSVWPGPTSSGLGVDHDYDTVAILVNPEVSVSITGPSTVSVNGYYFDPRDPAKVPDIVYLTIGQLRGAQAIKSDVQTALDRTWDPDFGALTSTDYEQIAKADPFYNNAGYDPSTDTTGRYVLPNNVDQTISYEPEPVGAGASCDTYNSTYNSSTTTTSSGSDKYTIGYSLDTALSVNLFVVAWGNIKASATLTYTNSWSSAINSGTSQGAAFYVCRPLSTDNYTGPINMQVWKDNVYGTFMFYPVN